jgi:periplasmic copper chaperone A
MITLMNTVSARYGSLLARALAATTLTLVVAMPMHAQTSVPAAPAIQVDGAWARATVQGQKASGAFMRLTAKTAMQLVAVASPVAGVAEVHEMTMDKDVMRMRAVSAIDLPAGKAVELKPGGYHVMLMDLKAPLKANTQVPLTLTFKDASGVQTRMEISLPVSTTSPAGAAAGMGGHKH